MAPGGRPVSDERLVALRGATTVDADTAGDVMGPTGEPLSTLLQRKGVGARVRSATTADATTAGARMPRTGELLSTLLERNGVEHDQLVSIIFTSTRDLRSAFPALAARELGLGDVPLLCAGELDVVG